MCSQAAIVFYAVINERRVDKLEKQYAELKRTAGQERVQEHN